MRFRTLVGSLQLPVAGLGTLVSLGALALLVPLGTVPARGGVLPGLAAVVAYVLAWGGFVVTAGGLAIPAEAGPGVEFNGLQRLLYVVAAALAVLSAGAPLLFWTVVVAYGLPLRLAATAWVAAMGLAVLAFLAAVCWRAVEAVARRLPL